MTEETINISNNLDKYLTGFKEERKKNLYGAFQQLAGKLLYGGHFVVADENDSVIRKVFLHGVEFYYHEENDGKVKDYIVYHRNPENPKKKPNPLPPFPTGSLHTHVSGVDITFEDQNEKAPDYRASALVRAFKVEEVKHVPGLLFSDKVDKRSTYFYNALFMGANILGGHQMKVYWKDNNVKECPKLEGEPRQNVGEFNPITHKKEKKFKQDMRPWAFNKK